jgi:alkylation response protein AidB-like acyl-CoA dehydrogenase
VIADVTNSLGTDYYLLDELFTDEEREIRDRVRAFADAEVIPIINEYWERADRDGAGGRESKHVLRGPFWARYGDRGHLRF